jgi:CTD small phosphatase-like protein 2
MTDDGADFSYPMLREGNEYTVYVKKRPYVDAFLKKVAEMFDVAVFTASVSSYADKLLDILDPGNRMISRRYYRESCLSVGGKYLKDLTIIEADLAKVAIIDNTPEVCYSATRFRVIFTITTVELHITIYCVEYENI